MKAMLLRVGIDKGAGGALGPIFEDGSFEYVPIPEDDPESIEDRTYKNTIGRAGKPLSTYLPKGIKIEKCTLIQNLRHLPTVILLQKEGIY